MPATGLCKETSSTRQRIPRETPLKAAGSNFPIAAPRGFPILSLPKRGRDPTARLSPGGPFYLVFHLAIRPRIASPCRARSLCALASVRRHSRRSLAGPPMKHGFAQRKNRRGGGWRRSSDLRGFIRHRDGGPRAHAISPAPRACAFARARSAPPRGETRRTRTRCAES